MQIQADIAPNPDLFISKGSIFTGFFKNIKSLNSPVANSTVGSRS